MYARAHFQYKQTIVTISADAAEYIDIAKAEILKSRLTIENYIAAHPFFEATLEAYEADRDAPPLIQKMIEAGNAFGIGPMSAVAGTIAGAAVEKMKSCGASFALADNGGDIALYNAGNEPVVVGVYAGPAGIRDLGFSVPPSDQILGICTSSGTVGPSVSFGIADAAVVFSKNPSLADAAATALGNALQKLGSEQIEKALQSIFSVPGVEGAVLIAGPHIGRIGSVPEFIRAHVAYDLITKG